MDKLTDKELTAPGHEVKLELKDVKMESNDSILGSQPLDPVEKSPSPVVDPDYSEEEIAKAKAEGWKPDKPNGLSPGEYNRRGPLIHSLKEQQEKIARQLERMQQLQSDMERKQQEAEQRGYEKAYAELMAKRDEAIDNGDRQAVHALDQQFDALRQARVQTSPIGASTIDSEAADYLEKNRDWLSDPDMFAVAQSYEQVLMAHRAKLGLPGLSPREQGIQIKEHVMKTFPHKFENQATTAPSPVVSASKSSVGSSSNDTYTINDLSEQQKVIYYRMKREVNPNLTPAEYLEKVYSAGSIVKRSK